MASSSFSLQQISVVNVDVFYVQLWGHCKRFGQTISQTLDKPLHGSLHSRNPILEVLSF